MLWLYRWLKGYLRVIFYGEAYEKIFNLTSRERITLWNTSLSTKGIESNIIISDFLKLPTVMKRSGIRIHILQKKGFPFRLYKNRKRAGIAMGIALMIIFLEIMSGYIWIIEVNGNKNVNESEIINACNDIGIRVGIKSNSIEPKTDRQKLLLKLDTLAWASLNIEGCRLTVNVSESKPKKDDNSCICNLKAKEDGIIKRIDVTSGNCVVKKGDAVKKGDVLVSGVLEKADKTEFLHSQGVVIATVKSVEIVEDSFSVSEIFETGKKLEKSVLEIYGIKLPLYLGKEKNEYISKNKIYEAKLFGQKIPLKLYKKKFVFIKKETIKLNEIALAERLHKKLDEKLKKSGIENYTIEKEDLISIDGGLRLKAIIMSEQNIAYRDKLIVSSED